MRSAILVIASLLFGIGSVSSAFAARPSLDDPKYQVKPWTRAALKPDIHKVFSGRLALPLPHKEYPQLCALLGRLADRLVCDEVKTAVRQQANFNEQARTARQPKGASTDVVSVIAGVLAEQAKIELEAWLLDELMKALCEPRDGPDETYFPRTCLLGLHNDSYSLLRMKPTLVRMGRRDLRELPAYAIWRASGQKEQAGYVLTNVLIEARKNQTVFQTLLPGLAESAFVRSECNDKRQCALYYLGLMSQVYAFIEPRLDANAPAQTWNDFALFSLQLLRDGLCPDKCANDPESARAWLTKAEAMAGVVMSSKDAAYDLVSRVASVRARTAEVEIQAQALSRLMTDKASADVIADALTEVLIAGADLAAAILAMPGRPGDPGLQIPQLDGYVVVIRAITSASAAFESARYAEGVGHLAGLLRCLESKEAALEKCKTAVPFYVSGIANESFLWYLSEIAVIADAKSDPQQAASRFFLPAGSWKVKRGKGKISIGALVGGGLGQETLKLPDGTEYKGTVATAFAPLGVDFSYPIKSYTVGAFISLLDVGNIVSARFSGARSGDVSETKSHPKLSDVISPGVFVRVGLGKTPWVLAVGAARTPDLKTAKLNTGEEVHASSTRVLVTLGIDIPIKWLW